MKGVCMMFWFLMWFLWSLTIACGYAKGRIDGEAAVGRADLSRIQEVIRESVEARKGLEKMAKEYRDLVAFEELEMSKKEEEEK